MAAKRFRIVYTIDVTLDESEIWPDGDGPSDPTAADVEQAIRAANAHLIHTMVEWSLADEHTFDVSEVK